jgi:hypothetical protein
MYETIAAFANDVLQDPMGLQTFVVRLDDVWLQPAADTFAYLGCAVSIDFDSLSLTVTPLHPVISA